MGTGVRKSQPTSEVFKSAEFKGWPSAIAQAREWKTFKTRPQQEAPGREADPWEKKKMQSVKGKVWPSIKQQVTIGECGDQRSWD